MSVAPTINGCSEVKPQQNSTKFYKCPSRALHAIFSRAVMAATDIDGSVIQSVHAP